MREASDVHKEIGTIDYDEMQSSTPAATFPVTLLGLQYPSTNHSVSTCPCFIVRRVQKQLKLKKIDKKDASKLPSWLDVKRALIPDAVIEGRSSMRRHRVGREGEEQGGRSILHRCTKGPAAEEPHTEDIALRTQDKLHCTPLRTACEVWIRKPVWRFLWDLRQNHQAMCS